MIPCEDAWYNNEACLLQELCSDDGINTNKGMMMIRLGWCLSCFTIVDTWTKVWIVYNEYSKQTSTVILFGRDDNIDVRHIQWHKWIIDDINQYTQWTVT